MLMNVFSSMDSQVSIAWFTVVFPVSVMIASLWYGSTQESSLTSSLMSVCHGVSSQNYGSQLTGFGQMLSALFYVLVSLNLLGLVPYVLPITSQLWLTLSLSSVLWLSLIMSSINSSVISTFAGLVPSGSPMSLVPFLVCIELVSISIRPLTLAVRLAANISAGHLILGLLGSFTIKFFSISVIMVLYSMFEVFIGLIQAYVFFLLLSLYADDHAHSEPHLVPEG